MRVEYQAENHYYSRTGLNLSSGGMFVQTDSPPACGAPVRMIFSLPGVPLLFDLEGQVKWRRGDVDNGEQNAGMGVMFNAVDESIRRRLENYVSKGNGRDASVLRFSDRLRKRGPNNAPDRHLSFSNQITQPGFNSDNTMKVQLRSPNSH